MSIFEYDEELHKKTLLEEGYEKGLECGIMRGRSEGKADERVQSILCLLEELGTVPETVRQAISSTKDMEVLRRWLKLAAKASSIDEFIQAMEQKA